VRDLTSQELKDNRRLYRSTLLLDQDGPCAASISLFAYDDAGLIDMPRVKLRGPLRPIQRIFLRISFWRTATSGSVTQTELVQRFETPCDQGCHICSPLCWTCWRGHVWQSVSHRNIPNCSSRTDLAVASSTDI